MSLRMIPYILEVVPLDFHCRCETIAIDEDPRRVSFWSSTALVAAGVFSCFGVYTSCSGVVIRGRRFLLGGSED